jgi:hypothetical protein
MLTITEDQGDIVYTGTATCFGGPGDLQDNGIGAWGFPYRRFASDLPYCALPIRGVVPSLANSPIPSGVPRYLPVRVYLARTGKSVWCAFVDYGPSGGLSSGAGIDLGPAAIRALGYVGNVDEFEEKVEVRLPECGRLLAGTPCK